MSIPIPTPIPTPKSCIARIVSYDSNDKCANSISKSAALKWHSVKENITDIIQLNAKIVRLKKNIGGTDKTTKGSGTLITEPRDLGLCRGIKSSIAATIHVRKNGIVDRLTGGGSLVVSKLSENVFIGSFETAAP